MCPSSSQLFESYPAPNRHRHALRVASESEKAQRQAAAFKRRQASGHMTDEDRRRAAGFADDTEGDDGEKGLDSAPSLALQPGPPIYLVPLHGREMMRARLGEEILHGDDDDADEAMHPIYKLMSTTRRSSSSASSAPVHALEFALLLSYQYGHGTSARHIISPKHLSSCQLNFLKSVQQVHRLRGVERNGGAYVITKSSEQPTASEKVIAHLKGALTFAKHKRSAKSSRSHRLAASSIRESWEILTPYIHPSSGSISVDPWPSSMPVDDTDAFSARLASDPRCQFDVDAPTVFLESDARTYGTVASQTRGLMAGLCAPIVSAVTGTFDAIVGGFVTNAAQEFLPGGVADSLVEQVTRQLPPMIARIIIPTIGESIAGTLPIATENKITPYAAHGISYKTTHDIVEDLTKNLVINIHRLVDVEMPKVSLAIFMRSRHVEELVWVGVLSC